MDNIEKVATTVGSAATITSSLSSIWNWFRSLFVAGPKQGYLVEGNAKVGAIIFQSVMQTFGVETVKKTITTPNKEIIGGIASLPIDDNTPSPNCLITEGGIGCDYAVLQFTPTTADKCACKLIVVGQ